MFTRHSIKGVLVLILLALLTTSIQAQGSGQGSGFGQGFGQGDRQWRFEDMKAKRAAFFTERIGLTTREAERFWPVYNSLQNEKAKLDERRRKLFQMTKLNNKGEKIPDFEKISDEMINIKLKEATLEKLYHDKFKKILTPEKMMNYYRTEEDWGRELLKQFQRRG